MKKRSIAAYVILSLVTCGIYLIVVNYKQMTEAYQMVWDQDPNLIGGVISWED